ncbi:MAG: hypothetical protein C0600_07125 [Ignavibacteria bacterium]|nr:MAG: hypothetical protein C0600_07125 [Ignavibacteria bacterium]
MKSFTVSVLLLCCIAPVLHAQSDVPSTMSYQGYLTDLSGAPVADGNYILTFFIYNQGTGGSPLWTEVHPSVPVTKGFFHIILGRGNPASPLTIMFDDSYFLGIKVGTDPELAPRIRLTTSAYSFMSRSSEKVTDPEVLTESELVEGAGIDITNTSGTLTISATGGPGFLAGDVTGPLNANVIADNAVNTAKIAPDIVSSLDGVRNDGGDIDLVAGANVTITPDDAANTITIAAAGGGTGLTLPYSGSAAVDANPAFVVTNNGIESAGRFAVDNTSASNAALEVGTSSQHFSGYAISAWAQTGRAFYGRNFSDVNPTVMLVQDGNEAGLRVMAKGTGSGIISDHDGSGPGIEVEQTGTGSAAYFHIDHTTSSANCVRAETSSPNSTAIEATASSGNAVHASSSGVSPTGEFENSNASVNAYILSAKNSPANTVFSVRRSGIAWASELMNAKAHISREDLGATSKPVQGYTYRDNITYAWAKVASAGSVLGGFGVDVARTGAGTYNITYKLPMGNSNDAAPTVTPYQSSGVDIAVISSSSTTGCVVKIYNWNNSTKNFELSDSIFFFQLCGRP